jgi:hypothetical protein
VCVPHMKTDSSPRNTKTAMHSYLLLKCRTQRTAPHKHLESRTLNLHPKIVSSRDPCAMITNNCYAQSDTTLECGSSRKSPVKQSPKQHIIIGVNRVKEAEVVNTYYRSVIVEWPLRVIYEAM